MSINNIQHFLLAQEDNIVSIPGLAARIEALEAKLGLVSITRDDETGHVDIDNAAAGGSEQVTFSPEDHFELFPEESFSPEDHDELFADGGATEQSWDRGDHAELFESPNI